MAWPSSNGCGVSEKGPHIFLYAFDLLELDCSDLRAEPFEVRKATPASVLRGCQPGLRFNEHLAHAGDLILCKMGLKASCRSPRLTLSFRSNEGLAEVQES
jgi:hypothetical protein